MNYVTTKEAAYLLGMPVRTLNHHVKYDRAPKHGYDQYDPAELIQWYADYMRARLREAQNKSGEKEARTAKLQAQARIAQMDADEKAGLLVRVAEVVEYYGRVVMAAKSRLLAMGTSIAPRMLACTSLIEVKTLIDDAIWDALDQLARVDMPKVSIDVSQTHLQRHPNKNQSQKGQTNAEQETNPQSAEPSQPLTPSNGI